MRIEWLSLSLLLCVLLTAVSVAVVKHQWRKGFIEFQQLQAREDDFQVEWGRLQLEEGARSAHGFIEAMARDRLGMRLPGKDDIRVLVAP